MLYISLQLLFFCLNCLSGANKHEPFWELSERNDSECKVWPKFYLCCYRAVSITGTLYPWYINSTIIETIAYKYKQGHFYPFIFDFIDTTI